MDAPAFLAFDLGASSGRAVLGTLRDGCMDMEVLHRFPTPLVEREQGGRTHLFWDTEALWADLREGLRRARAAAPGLRSLSVDSWAVDYVPLGADGRPLRLPYAYRDARTEGALDRAFAVVPRAEIFAATGIQFLPFNTLYQLLADDPAERARAAAHLPIADSFNHRFGGRPAVEVSMASTTQFMNVRTADWDRALLGAFGLDAGAWPEIVPSGTVLGEASEAPGVAVVASCSHDTGCAVAAVPAEGDGWAYISCGTWSLLGVERAAPLLSDAARDAGFTNEAGADGTIRFLKNLTGLWALQECAREWGGATDWSALEAEAASAPPHAALIDLEDPRFAARGGMEARVREAARAVGAEPASRGALARLLLESLADSYRRALIDLARVTGEAVHTVHLVGGGSQNRLLAQLTADACGARVLAGPAEATALGNLLLQARAMGALPAGATVRSVAAASSDVAAYTPR
jgi:rhamnulokinase